MVACKAVDKEVRVETINKTMKNIKQIFSFFFIFSIGLLNAQEIVNSNLYDEYMESGIAVPVLEIITVDGVEPTGESVNAPTGCVGVAFVNNEYVPGRLRIILQGDTLYDSGNYLASKSGMRVKIRGNTSAGGEKKPYKIKLSKKADLLLRSNSDYKDKEWVLLRNSGNSIIKFITTSYLAEMLGFEWVPQYRYVNLVLNGDFKGDYLLVENVKRGEKRVDVDADGFIIEDDAYWWENSVYFKGEMLPYSVGYTFKYPDADDVNDSIIADIRDYILQFEERLITGGDVAEFIDVDNFAAFLLAQDILGQYDSYGTNRFLYRKNKNSVMKMGPLWDSDGAFRKTNDWCDLRIPNGYSFYFKKLLERDDFNNSYLSLWNEIRVDLKERMSLAYDSIGEGFAEDFDRCRFFDAYRWNSNMVSYENCVKTAVAWFEERVPWMDKQLMESACVDAPCAGDDVVDIYTIDGRIVCSGVEHGGCQSLPQGFYIVRDRKTGESGKISIK